jgi:transcription-repair coupling factor (superfamily II helicase)
MKKRKTGITGIADSRSAACAGRLIREKGGCWIVVTPTYGEAERMAADLSFFVKKKICLLPEEEEAVLSFETRSRDNTWGRLRILRTLLEDGDCVVVGAAGAVLEHLPPPQAFTAQCLTLEAGDEVDVAALAGRLVAMGYERVPLVYAPGQFSLRGEILDVFTPYEDDPLRIELFDTEVESLRTFDAETQRSLSHLGSVRLYPATLLVRDEDALTGARQRIGRACRDLPERRRELLEALDSFAGLPRLEMYLDYFYDRPSHLWEYGGEKTPRIFVDDPNRAWEHLEAAEQERRDAFDVYLQQGKAAAADLDHYPSRRDLRALYDSGELWLGMLFARQLHGIEQLDALEHIESRQVLAYNGKLELLERDLRRYAERGYDTVIVCATAERRSNMDEYLVRSGLQGRARVCAGHLSTGMELPQEHRVYLSDADIFGQTRRRRHRHRASMENAQPIRSFADIQSGDYVVHESHGIGRYLGLEQLTVGGEVREYMKIRYAGDDLLYVPAEQTNVIQKYIGSEEAAPKVSRLAGSEWRTTKAKARASVANMAQELLRVSARRASSPGHAFSPDTVWQQQFEDSFPYEETDDQLRALAEVKRDMEQPKPMDRLICGDVGYGKTEVALRAAFKAVTDGRQVAVLVPTTVLAQQHYYTFEERLRAFPVRVEMLSRFRSVRSRRRSWPTCRTGKVDIVIGTHRLIQRRCPVQGPGPARRRRGAALWRGPQGAAQAAAP